MRGTAMKEKAAWLSDMYAAVAQGAELQYRDSLFSEYRHTDDSPNLYSLPSYWRIKPEPREHISTVLGDTTGMRFVTVPACWPIGTRVEVVEMFDE